MRSHLSPDWNLIVIVISCGFIAMGILVWPSDKPPTLGAPAGPKIPIVSFRDGTTGFYSGDGKTVCLTAKGERVRCWTLEEWDVEMPKIRSLFEQATSTLRITNWPCQREDELNGAYIFIGGELHHCRKQTKSARSSTAERDPYKVEVAGAAPAGQTMDLIYPKDFYVIEETFEATISWYSPYETCPGGQSENCIGADGSRPKAGETAACPRRYGFGTRILIDGVGERICRDRLHHRFDNRFDIFTESYAEAVRQGKQTLEVKILKPI